MDVRPCPRPRQTPRPQRSKIDFADCAHRGSLSWHVTLGEASQPLGLCARGPVRSARTSLRPPQNVERRVYSKIRCSTLGVVVSKCQSIIIQNSIRSPLAICTMPVDFLCQSIIIQNSIRRSKPLSRPRSPRTCVSRSSSKTLFEGVHRLIRIALSLGVSRSSSKTLFEDRSSRESPEAQP